MINKLELTKRIAGQLELPNDPKSVRKFHRTLWLNPRSTVGTSLRLSEEGYDIFVDQLKLQEYPIDIPKDTELTSELLLRLYRYLESPNNIQKKRLVVFRQKTAIELILFGGDIQKYGKAKATSSKKSA